MKTVLIPLSQAVTVKNIVRTDVLKTVLKDPKTRVICVGMNPERTSYYQTILKHDRLSFESFSGDLPSTRTERFFSFIKFYTISTKTTEQKRYHAYLKSGNLLAYLGGKVLNMIASYRPVRKVLRSLDMRLIPDSPWTILLEKYKPDLVVLPNLFDDIEIALLRDARRRSVQTLGYINTWDKVTARAGIRLVPDKMCVFNEVVKEEIVQFADMAPENIQIVGMSQYDILIKGVPNSREDFCAKKKLDPSKRIILFAPIGSTFSNSDWDLIDLLHEQIESGLIPNAQLLVRFQPNDFADKIEIGARPWMAYDLPGIRFGSERGGDWDMTGEDMQHLVDTLTHASVVICYASSISIDAALMGKPVINIDFELRPITDPSKTATHYYKTEHYGKALATGGIMLPKNPEELVTMTNEAIAHPELMEEQRNKLVVSQCGYTDGHSSERFATFILEQMRS